MWSRLLIFGCFFLLKDLGLGLTLNVEFFFFFIVGVLRVIVISVMLDSPVSQTIKCLSAIKETQVQSLGREDPLEKEMATHSGIRAWKIPWMEEPGRLQSMGSQGVRHDSVTSLSESLLFP